MELKMRLINNGINSIIEFSVFIFFIFIFIFSGFTLAQSNCPDGMVAYWKLNESGAVNNFIDIYGSNHGSCSQFDCPTEDIGILSRARYFDGNSGISVPDNIVFDWSNNTSFSIEAWVKTTEPGTGNKVFIGKYRGGSNMSWWLGYGDSNKAIFSVRDSDGNSAQAEATSILNDGNWHHIVGVRNNELNVIQVFVDGIKENETSILFTGGFSGSNPVSIGYFDNSYNFTGLLDEIAVYDTALTENLIAEHYTDVLADIDYCGSPTRVDDDFIIFNDFVLYQNYPNPFNPVTIIKYDIPVPGNIELKIYDILGREVMSLVNNERREIGRYEVQFNASNLPSGVYIYRLHANDYVSSKMMLMVK
jgi:hypothetical protein